MRLAENFRHDRPEIDLDARLTWIAAIWADVWRDPGALASGLPFSLTLLSILLAHELGHYIACRIHRVEASLPYFIPDPLFFGTFGGFVSIRSPIYTKRALFDVSVAGPIAGFVLLVPALAAGVAWSKTLPGAAERGDLVFGSPPLLLLVERLVFPDAPASDVSLHPVARAAWIGLIATALNLLPIEQLDGGNIVYAFFSQRYRSITRAVLIALVPIGLIFWLGWLIPPVLVRLFRDYLRRPAIHDDAPLGSARTKLGLVALAILVLCFTLTPVTPGASRN